MSWVGVQRGLLVVCILRYASVSLVAQGSDTIFLDLKRCADLVLQNDLNIQKSLLSMQSARIDQVSAYMNLLPSLDFNLSTGNSWGRSIDPTSNGFVEQQIQSISMGGASSWMLFQGLRDVYSIRRADIDLETSREDLEIQRNLSVLSVMTLVLDVLINQELLSQARFQLESSEDQLRRTQRMLEVGSVAELAYLDVRAEQASNAAEVVRAENTLRFSLLRLRQLLLLPYEAPMAVRDKQLEAFAEQLPQKMNTSVASIYEEALRLRPEIKRADLRIQSAELGLKIQRGSLFPSLSLNANLRTNYSSAADRPRNILGDPMTREVEIGYLSSQPSEKVLRTITTPEILGVEPSVGVGEQFMDNLSRSLFLNLSVPVFRRWNNRTNIQKAYLSYHRARIEAQEARNILRAQIEKAYNDLTAALQTYRFAELKWKAAEESFRAADIGYDLGTVHYTNYRVQSNRLYQARSEWIRSKYVFVFRQKIIEFYLGQLTY